MYSYERRDIYLYLQDKLQELFETVSLHLKTPLCEITHRDIWKYLEDDGIMFDSHGLPDGLKDYVAGTLFIHNQKIKIAINQFMPKVRQNFSRMHEVIHLIDDVDTTENSQTFSNIIKNSGYNTEEQRKEIKAEIGASILMLNDWALMYYIAKGTSWTKLRRTFEISEPALRYRIADFLDFECGIYRQTAWDIASAYQAGNNYMLYQTVKEQYRYRLDYAPTRILNLLER